MKLTDLLMGEHGVFYAMFDHLEATAAISSLDEIHAQGALLGASLASHAHLEDAALFTAVEPHFGSSCGPVAVMRMEHEEIERGLDALPTIEPVERARELLLHVIAVARSHFAKEERILFPMAEEFLGEAVLRQLAEKWVAARLKEPIAMGCV
jgi:iron-sulfur cluster repair protein YtfE (RIC family)